mmetsp:Transcript_52870/g.152392  ORF Transcript_52870/g.152392 Transcript_52870/m.152392 type:complete len:224 (-) Transcript_52870:466-1137(-)
MKEGAEGAGCASKARESAKSCAAHRIAAVDSYPIKKLVQPHHVAHLHFFPKPVYDAVVKLHGINDLESSAELLPGQLHVAAHPHLLEDLEHLGHQRVVFATELLGVGEGALAWELRLRRILGGLGHDRRLHLAADDLVEKVAPLGAAAEIAVALDVLPTPDADAPRRPPAQHGLNELSGQLVDANVREAQGLLYHRHQDVLVALLAVAEGHAPEDKFVEDDPQ